MQKSTGEWSNEPKQRLMAMLPMMVLAVGPRTNRRAVMSAKCPK
jgi:hypothetical protein